MADTAEKCIGVPGATRTPFTAAQAAGKSGVRTRSASSGFTAAQAADKLHPLERPRPVSRATAPFGVPAAAFLN